MVWNIHFGFQSDSSVKVVFEYILCPGESFCGVTDSWKVIEQSKKVRKYFVVTPLVKISKRTFPNLATRWCFWSVPVFQSLFPSHICNEWPLPFLRYSLVRPLHFVCMCAHYSLLILASPVLKYILTLGNRPPLPHFQASQCISIGSNLTLPLTSGVFLTWLLPYSKLRLYPQWAKKKKKEGGGLLAQCVPVCFHPENISQFIRLL